MYLAATNPVGLMGVQLEALRSFETPALSPFPCDRWIARSLLHKACRRGETRLAWRALATLMRENPAGIWRALAIIGMEDVGVSGIDSVGAVVAAGRDRRWRQRNGGEWKVAAWLTSQLCAADHDQAACDLFERARYDPDHAAGRDQLLDADMHALADVLHDADRPLIERAMAALAMGGGLVDGQRHRDPFAVFELLAEQEHCHEIVGLSRDAWRVSRCELALVFPLVWSAWRTRGLIAVRDDDVPPISWLGELPDYAVDQFTRAGVQVARQLLVRDGELRRTLDEAGIPRTSQHRTVGDLIFLLEGGRLTRRAIWPTGDNLRLPHRCLADTVMLGAALPRALSLMAASSSTMKALRSRYYLPQSSGEELDRLL